MENKHTEIGIKGQLKFELDNYPQGWGFVRPGQKPRRHRIALNAAKAFFGLEHRKDLWWVPVGVKLGNRLEAEDLGIFVPDYVPMEPGKLLSDMTFKYTDYSAVQECLVEVELVLRFPLDEGGITTDQIPNYWYKGRRRKRRNLHQ